MKHTNEVQAILTAIFAINRTSEHEGSKHRLTSTPLTGRWMR